MFQVLYVKIPAIVLFFVHVCLMCLVSNAAMEVMVTAGITKSLTHSPFQFTLKVLNTVELRALCKPIKFFDTELI